MVKDGKFITMDTQINKDSFTGQGRDTSAAAASGGLVAPARSTTSSDCSTPLVDHLAKGERIVDTPSETLVKFTGSCGTEFLTLRDVAISQEDSRLEELREVLKETLRTITKKRTVASDVTAGVKEAALILTQLLTHRKTWKDAQRKLAVVEVKERERLAEDLKHSERLRKEVAQSGTPERKREIPAKNGKEHFSPPKGPEEFIVHFYSEVTARDNTPCGNEAPKGKRPLSSPEEGEREKKKKKDKESGDQKSNEAPFVVVEGKKKKKKRRKKEKKAAAGISGAKGPGQDGTPNGPATERTTASKEAKRQKR
ncbi:nucleolar protein 58-like [Microplitis mediator]|uniref:nucleolar protein 58-like n=1 Tax=Microplitis mediator TaxID=375433 RepID=UPI0025574DA6|nr:nucleolar protein 58-like [Microplitis mediator]